MEQVTRRTPGFHAWQDPHWLVHCDDAAAFIGEVGYTELAAHPEALDLRMAGSQGQPVQRRVRDGVRTTSVRVALAPLRVGQLMACLMPALTGKGTARAV
ncbi:CbrC family protein [Streptomyces sp. NBC_00365]|nr:CbrC family protein [Streptomyces sp. NBC_00365]